MPRSASSIFRFANNVESVRELAKKRLPKGLFEFVDRGSDDEIAIINNRAAFDRVKFRPRALIDVSGRSAESTVLGQTIGMPLAVAPTGAAGLVWYKGEMALAKAAAAAKVPFTLATRSMSAMEDIAAQAGGTLWLQLYTQRNRQDCYDVIERAKATKFQGLVLTVDTPTNPSRDYNDRNGYSLPFRYTVRGVTDILRHPRWFAGVIGQYYWRDRSLPRFENLPGRRTINEGISPTQMLSDDLTWRDIEEYRRRWPAKLIVKGILHPEDALQAARLGADAVVVSNHGGRNLDGSMAPLDALPDVVDVVGNRAEVFVDGGVRRGADIAKAIALGAKCVLIGRPTLYGTAAAGEMGATHVLNNIKKELLYTLATLGVPKISDLSRDIIHAPHLSLRGSHSMKIAAE
jgi:isopentenyl diphosphate isomerase/L-lactate dehydrogenase-like FMN-dependent dehydrogenase